jgi:hypothetical protein
MDRDSGFGSSDLSNLKLTKSELASNKEEASAASSLWQDAYNNPAKTGLELGAAALVAGGLVYAASRGRIGALGKQSVLVVEDTIGMGKAFTEALESSGHKVTWVTGIKSLKPLTGFTADGGEIALNKRFNVALLDGDLGKDRLTGPEIVGALRDRKIMSIGTSTVESFNNGIKANGGDFAITANKGVVYQSLFSKQLDLRAAVKTPCEVQAGLDALKAVMRLPENEAARKAADARLMEHMLAG